MDGNAKAIAAITFKIENKIFYSNFYSQYSLMKVKFHRISFIMDTSWPLSANGHYLTSALLSSCLDICSSNVYFKRELL